MLVYQLLHVLMPSHSENASKSDKQLLRKFWNKGLKETRTQTNYTHSVYCRFYKKKQSSNNARKNAHLPLQPTNKHLKLLGSKYFVLLKKNSIYLKGFLFVGYPYPCTLVSFFYCIFFLIFNLFLFQWKNVLDSKRRQAALYRRLQILY